MPRLRAARRSGALLLLVAAAVVLPRVSRGGPTADKSRAVIVISVDGLAAFYFDDPRAEMPTHSPDLVLFAREGYCFDDSAAGSAPTVPRREIRGMHGHDENLPCMDATFIAWGSGIRPHARLGEIQNTDVAPTIARLLDLPLTAADGKVLSAALAE
jgi:predicted AlkP superfamily pyrophosphatase or phosphodiesterase